MTSFTVWHVAHMDGKADINQTLSLNPHGALKTLQGTVLNLVQE